MEVSLYRGGHYRGVDKESSVVLPDPMDMGFASKVGQGPILSKTEH